MKKNSPLLIFICLFAILMCLTLAVKVGDFQGADDSIKGKVSQINEEYVPWFKSIWVPPSAKMEYMLFTLQAAAGAGFIGYYIWRKRNVQANNDTCEKQ